MKACSVGDSSKTEKPAIFRAQALKHGQNGWTGRAHEDFLAA
jgi:hypothetical protein